MRSRRCCAPSSPPPTRLELPDLISTLTEGNPFFVEELLFGHIARTIASYVPPPVGVKPAALWGTEERVRELFGEGIASLQATKRKTPEGRCGTPEDLIGAAIFFASAASDFVTGAQLPVDGGYLVAERLLHE